MNGKMSGKAGENRQVVVIFVLVSMYLWTKLKDY